MYELVTTLRRTLRLLGPERRWRWLFLVVMALVVAGLEVLGAVLIFVLLQLVATGDQVGIPLIGDLRQVMPDVDRETMLLVTAAVIALFFLVRGFVLIGQSYVQMRMVHNAAARLSAHLVRGYLAMPYLFHTRHNSAELVRNTFDSVSSLVIQIVLPLVKVVSQLLLLLGLAGVLLWSSPTATLIAVVVLLPLIWLLMRIIHPRLKKLGRRAQEAKVGSLKSVQQALGGVRDIKILGRESFFTRVFARERLKLARASYIFGAMAQVPRALIETTLMLVIVLLFVTAVVSGDSVEGLLSTLGVFAYVGLRIQPTLRDILNCLNDLKFGAAVLDDLTADRERVDVALELGRMQSTVVPAAPQLTNRIELRRVRFAYSREATPALVDIDLSIRRGEFIGICGPTGGGKSTMVDLLAGLLTPTEGEILVDGMDLTKVTPWWQQQLGVVSQAVFLIDDTIRNNIALGRRDEEIDESRLNRAVRRAQLESVVAELPHGLETMVGERGIRLSGGQRQRVAIARAFYREPAVLILDEGTSALDMATEAALVAAIGELKEGRTLIAVAHRISTVRNADRIVVVEAGRVAAVGIYENLLQQSQLFRTLAR